MPLQKMQPMQPKFNLMGPRKEAGVGGGGLQRTRERPSIFDKGKQLARNVQDKRAIRDAATKDALAQAQLAERNRVAQLTRRAREEILKLAAEKPPESLTDKTIGFQKETVAAQRFFKQLAHEDPAAAIQMAELVENNISIHNQLLLAAHQEVAQRTDKALTLLDELHNKPVRLSPGFGSLIAAVLTKEKGESINLGDKVTMDDRVMKIRAPSSETARLDLELPEVQAGVVRFAPNWPGWADKLLAAAGVATDNDAVLDKLENLIPWGEITVWSAGRDHPIARVPMLFPGKKMRQLEEFVKDTVIPEPPPSFQMALSKAEMLSDAATDIRKEGRPAKRGGDISEVQLRHRQFMEDARQQTGRQQAEPAPIPTAEQPVRRASSRSTSRPLPPEFANVGLVQKPGESRRQFLQRIGGNK